MYTWTLELFGFVILRITILHADPDPGVQDT